MGLRILPTCVILATLFACVRADGLDDFTNNLFTDLGPILALFGELVTMQFMSQAVGWVDRIALAMAPLGIVTIIVSAIRVGGPQWLKAVIEVCELFNGNSFIRCQGTAPVWEYICIIPKTANSGKERPLQFLTLDEAVDNGLLSKHKGGTRLHWSFTRNKTSESTSTPNTGDATYSIGRGANRRYNLGPLRQRRTKDARDVENQTSNRSEDLLLDGNTDNRPNIQDQTGVRSDNLPEGKPGTTEEYITVIRHITDNAPNITLNLQKSNLEKTNLQNTVWSRLINHVGCKLINYVAGLGVLLQLGVLAFFSVMTYAPGLKSKFQKNGNDVPVYGFPLAAGGTVLVVAGMFLCGLVVERSTEEEVYKAKEDHEIRIYWIQQSQTVSDQAFKSFAVFPKKDLPLASIIKSTRHRDIINAAGNGKKRTGLQWLTMFGVFIGLLGFITQFTGLRVMNSAASLAQLAAVAIMTALRSFARPGFSSSFERQRLLCGFELDWLAWKLVMEKGNDPTGQENEQPRSNEQPKPDKLIAGSWAVLTGEISKYKALELLTKEKKEKKETQANEILDARRELCKLAKFQGLASTEAIHLALAIEAALQTLFPEGPPKSITRESSNSAILPPQSNDGESSNSDVLPPQSTSGESPNSDTSHNQQGAGFRWLVNVTHSSSGLTNSSEEETQGEVCFDLNYADHSWHVLADSLDAALSLWVYTKQQSDRNEGETNCVGKENDEWLRRKVSQPCLRLFDPGEMLKAQLLQDLEWWAPKSTEHLSEVEEVEEIANSAHGQTEPTDSETFHAARVVGFNSSSTNNTKAQTRSLRISPARMANNKRALAIESRDSLERLYAKDLLFSFMCSAAKTPGAAIVGVAELRTVSTGNRAPRILWHKRLEKLADSFRSSCFETDQENLVSIIAPLSIGGILPFPHPIFKLMCSKITEEWQLRKGESAGVICGGFIRQMERYALGNSGLYDSMVAVLLEVQNDAEYQLRYLVNGKAAHGPIRTFSDKLSASIGMSRYYWEMKPEFFCELGRLFKKLRRPLIIKPLPFTCNNQRGENSNEDVNFNSHHGFTANTFPPYFNLSPQHILALEGSFAEEQADKRDFCGRTPLHYASMNDENAGALWGYFQRNPKDVDVNVKDHRGYTPLHYACALGRHENVNTLLLFNAKLDNQAIDGMYPMHLAAREGHVKVITKFLRTEARQKLTDAQERLTDYNGYLPIHWAAINGHAGIIQQLNTDINVASAENDTPLHLAVWHSEVNVVEALLNLPVDMEKTNHNGETALLVAVHMGKLEIAKRLIEKGANPNHVDGFGDTPLHGLISPRYLEHKKDVPKLCEVADSLVKKNADLGAKNKKGQTPADVAKGLRLFELQKHLLSLVKLAQ